MTSNYCTRIHARTHGTLSIRDNADCECKSTYKAWFFFPSILHYISINITGIKLHAIQLLVISGFRMLFQVRSRSLHHNNPKDCRNKCCSTSSSRHNSIRLYVYVKIYKCITSQYKEFYSNAQSVEFLLRIRNARVQVPSQRPTNKNEVSHCPSRQNMDLFSKVRHGSFIPCRFQFRIQNRSTFWPCEL